MIILILICSVGSVKALTCRIAGPGDNCNALDEKIVFKTSYNTNAHAEVPGGIEYDYRVCCAGASLGAGCGAGGAEILRLSSATNAHVEKSATLDPFFTENPVYDSYPICLSSSSIEGGLVCSYAFDSCPANYECIASLYSNTNSHVSQCSDTNYRIKICCNHLDSTPPSYVPPALLSDSLDESLCAVVDNSNYPPEKECWVGRNIANTVRIKHSDFGSGLGVQYISFTRNGCSPGSCPAGDEIRASYDIGSGTFSDVAGYVNNAFVDITEASCVSCLATEAEIEWSFSSGTSNENFKIWTFMSDKNGNNAGWDYINWWYNIDAVFPTISDDYANDNIEVTTPQTITITANDADSGIRIVRYCETSLTGDCNTDTGNILCAFSSMGSNVCQNTVSYPSSAQTLLKYSVWDFMNQRADGEVRVRINIDTSVVLIADPPSVDTIWQPGSAEARAECSGVCDIGSSFYAAAVPYSEPAPDCSNEGVFSYTDNPITVTEHSWVCAKSLNNIGIPDYTAAPMEFRIDSQPPVSQVNEIPNTDGWIFVEDCFQVTWSGSDLGGSGIENYRIEYRVGALGSWQEMGTYYSDTTSGAFCKDITDGETYYFRSVAIDGAGNEEVSGEIPADGDTFVRIDTSRPTAVLGSLSTYTNINDYYGATNGIPISWNVNDGTGSGIDSVAINYRNYCDMGTCGGSTCDATGIIPVAGNSGTTRLEASSYEGCTYEFEVCATDKVGNTQCSEKGTTTLDISYPINLEITEPSSEWTNQMGGITVSWAGADEISGIYCYTVQWSDNGGSNWYNLINCRVDTTTLFTSAPIVDGAVFDFRLAARDNAGNDMVAANQWVDTTITGNPIQIKVDLVEPETVTIDVTSDGTTPIDDFRDADTGAVKAEDVSQVIVDVDASDSRSGIQSVIIDYEYFNGYERLFDAVICMPADPYIPETCSHTFGYAEDTSLKFTVKARDVAGNIYESEKFQVISHPFANFLTGERTVTVGKSELIEVEVRNMDDVSKTLTLTLSEYDGEAYFPDSTEANKKIYIIDLNPNEERIVRINLGTTEPGDHNLRLQATDGITIDTDDLIIHIQFPSSFPGLDSAAVILILMLSVPVYMLARKRI